MSKITKKQASKEVDNCGAWIEFRNEEENITYCTKGSDGCIRLVPLKWFKFYDDDTIKLKKKYRKHLIPIKPLI